MAQGPQHFRGRIGQTAWWRQPVRHRDEYIWLVVVSVLDIMCTMVILALGGREVNPIAEHVLQAAGVSGIVFLKFAMVSLVICICEYITRQQPTTGLALAQLAVVISALPVVWALLQLLVHFCVVPLV